MVIVHEPDLTEIADDIQRACQTLTSAARRLEDEMERCGESHKLYDSLCDAAGNVDDALDSAQEAVEMLP